MNRKPTDSLLGNFFSCLHDQPRQDHFRLMQMSFFLLQKYYIFNIKCCGSRYQGAIMQFKSINKLLTTLYMLFLLNIVKNRFGVYVRKKTFRPHCRQKCDKISNILSTIFHTFSNKSLHWTKEHTILIFNHQSGR